MGEAEQRSQIFSREDCGRGGNVLSEGDLENFHIGHLHIQSSGPELSSVQLLSRVQLFVTP